MADPGVLWALLAEFTRLGLISFGGANLAEMERVLVGERGWIDAQTLANGFALGQVMPGPNLLAVTYYGFAVAGWAGAMAATLGFYGPTALLSAAVALLWRRHSAQPWVAAFRNALLPFGAGVLLAGALVLARGSVHRPVELALAAGASVLLWRTRLNAAVVVMAAALAGVLLGL